MGHKNQINLGDIARQINAAVYEMKSPYNDGFIGWGYKQDLYRLKWILEDALNRSPNFTPEPAWLKEQEQKKIIRYLSDEV